MKRESRSSLEGSAPRRARQRVPSYADGVDRYDEAALQRLKHLTAPHVDSFDYFLTQGMHAAVDDMSAMELRVEGVDGRAGPVVRMCLESVRLAAPSVTEDGDTRPMTPREARERGLNYAGAMSVAVLVEVDDQPPVRFDASLGDFPIMVRSEKCVLRGLSPAQLVRRREEALELGGYFIVNGIERIIRLLQLPRRNHPSAIERNSYTNRGAAYSNKGVAMRCVRRDQSSITLTLHYLVTGAVTLRLVIRKQEFLLPAVLVARALCEISDRELHDRVLQLGA